MVGWVDFEPCHEWVQMYIFASPCTCQLPFGAEYTSHSKSARLKAWPGHQTDEQDLWTSSAIKIGHLLVTGIKVGTHQQAAVLDSLMVEDRPVTDLGEQQSVK